METKQLSKDEKQKVTNALTNLYNPTSIGQIEKYPPNGEYFVTLYFDTDIYSIKVENRYNHPINEDIEDRFLCDFEISNFTKVGNELNVTVKVTKQ